MQITRLPRGDIEPDHTDQDSYLPCLADVDHQVGIDDPSRGMHVHIGSKGIEHFFGGGSPSMVTCLSSKIQYGC